MDRSLADVLDAGAAAALQAASTMLGDVALTQKRAGLRVVGPPKTGVVIALGLGDDRARLLLVLETAAAEHAVERLLHRPAPLDDLVAASALLELANVTGCAFLNGLGANAGPIGLPGVPVAHHGEDLIALSQGLANGLPESEAYQWRFAALDSELAGILAIVLSGSTAQRFARELHAP